MNAPKVMAAERWQELCKYILDDLLINIVADYYWDHREMEMEYANLTDEQQAFMRRRGFEVIDREPRDYLNKPRELNDFPYVYLIPSGLERGVFETNIMLFLKDKFGEPTWHLGSKYPDEMPHDMAVNMLEQLIGLCIPFIDMLPFPKDKPIKIYVHDGFKPWLDAANKIKEKYSKT